MDELSFHRRVDCRGRDIDHQPEPSASDFAVCTARPSFQNSSTQVPMIRTSPNSTPLIESRMRENHDLVVVSVNKSAESEVLNEFVESVSDIGNPFAKTST